MNYSVLIRLNGVYTIKYYHIHLHQKSTNKQIKTKNMTENKTSKMNLDHERKIVELQERVNKLEDLCFTTKEILKRKPCLIGCAAQSPCRRKKSERKQPQD